MTLSDIGTFHDQLVAAQRALDTWHAELPTSLQFSVQGGCAEHDRRRSLLRHAYFETKELLSRPSLYFSLHGTFIEHPPRQPIRILSKTCCATIT